MIVRFLSFFLLLLPEPIYFYVFLFVFGFISFLLFLSAAVSSVEQTASWPTFVANLAVHTEQHRHEFYFKIKSFVLLISFVTNNLMF